MICSMCGKDERWGHFVYCSKCRRYGHAECLELSAKVLSAIRSYDWRCMDCKVCVICSTQDAEANDEDNLLFCDYCDRGYHLNCVGLEKVPRGTWACPDCEELESEQFEKVEKYKLADKKKREKLQKEKELAKIAKEKEQKAKEKAAAAAAKKKNAKNTPAKPVNSKSAPPKVTPKSARRKGK